MTESEWLACAHPAQMVECLRGKASERKLRLLACGYFRLLPEGYTSATLAEACAAAEGCADGQVTIDKLNRLRSERVIAFVMTEGIRTENKIRQLLLSPRRMVWQSAQEFAALVVRLRGEAVFGDFRSGGGESIHRQREADRAGVARLIADIVGDPFRTVSVEPSWLASTVVQFAAGVYADRAFDRLPILADALEEAGCDNADMLSHCRGPGPHVRGCWVVDLLLGKV